MLWKIWKRMLWSLLALVVLVAAGSLSLVIADEDVSGGIAALSLFILFPLFVLVFFWGLFSAIKLTRRYRRGEDISYAFESRFRNWQEEKAMELAEVDAMGEKEKRRFYLFRIVGAFLVVMSLVLICIDGAKEAWGGVVFGTLILIAGCTFWVMASATAFNESNGIVKRIVSNHPLDINEIYEAMKHFRTALGSPYLARFSTMKRPALCLGPGPKGELVYAYLSKDGTAITVASTPLTVFLKERLTLELHPVETEPSDLKTLVSVTASALFLERQFFESLKSYARTGKAKPMDLVEPKHLYAFDESFKLTGQRFALKTLDGGVVYEVDGTFPLKTFRIKDRDGREVFSVSKEILNLMPTYRFMKDGKYYGMLSKQFDLTQDTFSMKTEEGELELEEIGASIGHNYQVTLNRKPIGYILDNLDLTVRNLVFDNSVIVMEDEAQRPLMTALAIMVAREIARDRDTYRDND